MQMKTMAKQAKACDAKLKGLSNGSQLQQVRCREGSAFLFFTKSMGLYLGNEKTEEDGYEK